MWIWMIIRKLEVFKPEAEYILHFRVKRHPRLGFWITAQLLFDLFQMVKIDMRITECMDKIAWLQFTYLGHHQCQKGVACNVKRNTQKNIG